MTQHTPGPWQVSERDPLAIYSEDQHLVAETVWRHDGRGAAAQANARLIAAAPSLLAALKAAVECGMVPTSSATEGGAMKHVKQVHVADQIRAAIAKAEGRP